MCAPHQLASFTNTAIPVDKSNETKRKQSPYNSSIYVCEINSKEEEEEEENVSSVK